jgi:hypothetical protein
LGADGALALGAEDATDRVDEEDDEADVLLSLPPSLTKAITTTATNAAATPHAHRLLIDPTGLTACAVVGVDTPGLAYAGAGAAGAGGAEIVQFTPSQ